LVVPPEYSETANYAKTFADDGGVTTIFDQEELIDEVVEESYGSLSEEEKKEKASFGNHFLLKWGVLYYPLACATKKCPFQMVLHGSDM